MKLSRESYREVYPAPLSEVEVDALWEGVKQAEPRARTRRRTLQVALAAAVCAGVALVWLAQLDRGVVSEPVAAGQTISAPAEQTVELPDGSRVQLEQSARVRLATLESTRVQVRLLSGRAMFEVAPVADRQFVVLAADVRVVATGTRFSVELRDGVAEASPHVEVAVREGGVSIAREGAAAPVHLAAGESWSRATSQGAPASTAELPAPSAPPPAAPAPSAEPPAAAPGRPSAVALFERANQLRRAGRSEEAAAVFDRLRRTYPDDPRAGVAALQLARIRMDELGDAEGAARALEDSKLADTSNATQEDAAARLVHAYDRTGKRQKCLAARQAYLSRYPQGTHRAAVSRACAKR